MSHSGKLGTGHSHSNVHKAPAHGKWRSVLAAGRSAVAPTCQPYRHKHKKALHLLLAASQGAAHHTLRKPCPSLAPVP